VVANTGDDVEIYGAHVSPDPDLVALWLADRIDARGWGLAGDTFHVMDGLRELGTGVWFNLGDRDLAIGIERARRLAQGARLTEAIGELCRALGIAARVLPMCDEPVRTRVRAHDRWQPFQEFMILGRGEGPVQDVAFDGIEAARPAPEVLDALARARAIVIGPSNPVVSIGPILAVPGMRDALRAAPAPVVAVSPIVGGAPVKGPADRLMGPLGIEVSCVGVARAYAEFCSTLVIDAVDADAAPAVERAGVHAVVADTMMRSPEIAADLARCALAAVA
jgi:LPPG:FO 2-phospho-L-lactate transferase